jgi:hypothetical protein
MILRVQVIAEDAHLAHLNVGEPHGTLHLVILAFSRCCVVQLQIVDHTFHSGSDSLYAELGWQSTCIGCKSMPSHASLHFSPRGGVVQCIVEKVRHCMPVRRTSNKCKSPKQKNLGLNTTATFRKGTRGNRFQMHLSLPRKFQSASISCGAISCFIVIPE